MALTTAQMISLGFKPSKRSSIYKKKYDTLVYPITETDFLYIGYNEYSQRINNKILWKSFKQVDTGERITYPVIHLGDTSFGELKNFLQRSKDSLVNFAIPEDKEEANSPMAVEEGSSMLEFEKPVSEDTVNLIKETADVNIVETTINMMNGEKTDVIFDFKNHTEVEDVTKLNG